MKVFISHSGPEEWLVKLIAAELNKLGIVAYHYEQNEMGTLIQETIDKEVAECDEFLVLVTPTSVTSPWVIDEIAGAARSRKPIVAFYMYVDDRNVLPRLKNVVQRPIKDLQIYYDELRRRMMNALVDEQTKVHEKADSDTPPPLDFAVGEVQQAIRNPFNAAELRDLFRRILALSLAKPVTPPEQQPPAKPPTKRPTKPRTKRPTKPTKRPRGKRRK